ncbi:uncharacterized protein A4U43_C01F33400 [Asparagus officinalis]|uniref:TBCC domain-containing protein 1 n=1 Tax=Asparagus officinalis TaxID=4686 RepID=A0A5P1FWT8_ASPOF|nr:TBCC domain-containing protein 1-like [Asparagus officinalis]ONK81839.1 uncharacterized protein A4U43_C01F33400 [Asparagus officinalis]
MSSEETPNSPPPSPSLLILPRRESFDYGLLPIPNLIFNDGTLTLIPLRDKLLSVSPRVDAQTLAEALQISIGDADLVIETLFSVLPADPGNGDERGVDVHDLLVFLYVQSYKRLVTRPHKDASTVATSMSAFDGCLSALSPLQLVRSNSRRFMPSQSDDEAHQLSFLQKHMANILTLLADPVDGDDESLVITGERFQHLDLLVQFVENGCEVVPSSKAVPFFVNSDPDMLAVPASAAQVLDWVLQNIATSLEKVLENTPTKENGSTNTLDLDMATADASKANSTAFSRSQTFVEGISKTSVVKQSSDIKGHSVKVLNCQDSVIYILAPLKYATVYGCSESTIVLGAVGKVVRVEHCERVQVITATKRICIANCRDCLFFLGVNQQPLIIGDNHKLQVAPYNTFYPQLEEHMAQVGINATVNRWAEPRALGMVDPHDSLSHPAGVSDVQAESATCLDPDQFTNFVIPKLFGAESTKPTKDNPFPLPESYIESQKKTHSVLCDIQQVIRNAQLEENKKQEVSSALHVHFKDWLYATGNIRQLYCLQ